MLVIVILIFLSSFESLPYNYNTDNDNGNEDYSITSEVQSKFLSCFHIDNRRRFFSSSSSLSPGRSRWRQSLWDKMQRKSFYLIVLHQWSSPRLSYSEFFAANATMMIIHIWEVQNAVMDHLSIADHHSHVILSWIFVRWTLSTMDGFGAHVSEAKAHATVSGNLSNQNSSNCVGFLGFNIRSVSDNEDSNAIRQDTSELDRISTIDAVCIYCSVV